MSSKSLCSSYFPIEVLLSLIGLAMAQLDSRRSAISEFGLDPEPIRVGFVVDGEALGPVFFVPNT